MANPPIRLCIDSFLEKVPLGSEQVSNAPMPSNVIDMYSVDNKVLLLAQRENFAGMCRNIRWGSEDENEFGEFLRAALLEFLPTSRMQLMLLSNIVAIQWKLQRLQATAKNVFEHGPPTPGKFNLPAASHDAQEVGTDSTRLLSDLEKAIKTYYSVVGRGKK